MHHSLHLLDLLELGEHRNDMPHYLEDNKRPIYFLSIGEVVLLMGQIVHDAQHSGHATASTRSDLSSSKGCQ